MTIAPNILGLVGHTPLVRLSRIGKGLRPAIVAKLEHLNPGGSVKDRIGLLMIEDAERRGLLRPGGTIVEPTSGNTGVGLAMAAAIKGYRLICTMADKQSQEKRDLLRAYGAEVVVCPSAVPPESPESYYKVADRLTRDIPGAFQPNQYYNAMNPEAHYKTTGPEIWEQTEGRITHLVAGVGTGGTVTGAGRFIKEQNKSVVIVGADPEGSLYTGDIHPYKTEGIGEDFYPGTFDPAVVDRWVRVSDRDAFLTARRLTREEGILVGGSSGTAMFAALEIAKDLDEKALVLVLFADSGRSYLSKIFNDEWMRQNGFLGGLIPANVGDVMKDRGGTPELIVVSKTETVRRAIDTMQRYGISQIPVTANGAASAVSDIVGSVSEKTMLDRVFREPALVDERVERVMDPPFPVVQATDDIERLYQELSGGAPALLAARDNRPVSVITKADLLEFVAHQRKVAPGSGRVLRILAIDVKGAPRKPGFETLAIHAGQEPEAVTGAVVVPIFQTSTFAQEAVGKHKGYEYARTGNPTRTALETCLAALEGGRWGLAFASGMAATDAVAHLLSKGDHVVMTDDVYGGTYRLFTKVFARLGIGLTAVDMRKPEAARRAMRPRTKLVWIETPSNPLMKVLDIAALAEIAHKGKALAIVDNTFASPYLQQPLKLGADVVLHSTTKYLGGHSDVVGGGLAGNAEELRERIAFLQNAAGGVPGPFDAWLVLRGAKTLAVRMERHSANAQAVAEWLAEHPKVTSVNYPGLVTHPQHALARRQMRAFGGMLSFELRGGEVAAKRMAARTKIFALAESLGGVESLIEIPLAMTHGSVRGTKLAPPAGLVRLSVGIETVDDLIGDLGQAIG